MEGLELLQNLDVKRTELIGKKETMTSALKKGLFDLFKTLKGEEGPNFYERPPQISRPWSLKDEGSPFEVRLELSFETTDPERLERGYKTEFGCDISLTIHEDGMEMNYGTCGSYSSKDIGQMARAFLIPKLWLNEGSIIKICKDTVDMSVIDELCEINGKISQINWDIQQAENARKKAETVAQLRQAKYICQRYTDTKYKRDEHGFYVENEKGDWIALSKVYKYSQFEKIVKVTDKSVLTKDEQYLENHRHPLDEIVAAVQRGSLFLQKEKVLEEPVPEEGGAN